MGPAEGHCPGPCGTALWGQVGLGTSEQATPTQVLLGTKVTLGDVTGMGRCPPVPAGKGTNSHWEGPGGMESENNEEMVDLWCSVLWMLQATRRYQQGEIVQQEIFIDQRMLKASIWLQKQG